MKILFIGPLPPPMTGHSLAVKVMLDGLEKEHQLEVVNLSKKELTHGANSLGRIVEIFKILKEVWHKKNNVDAIYLTISESVAGNLKDLLIYLICSGNLNKMIIHLHGGSLKKHIFDRFPLLYKINRFFIKKLGAVIVLGNSHVEIFKEIIAPEKIFIVPNFAEEYVFLHKEQIAHKFSSLEPLRILFLSNLIDGKGYEELLGAFQELTQDQRQRVRIDFAGAFESDEQKNAFLKKASAPEIKYHGIVGAADKKELLSTAHVFCLPTSLFEGQPISILEAYAAGCVVMTTDRGGIPDIFTGGVNGYQIAPQSSNSIKMAIEEILDDGSGLLAISLLNRSIAENKYRTAIYNSSLKKIIEGV
ncbi:glycosyltransferase family 4 protein [Janthinobacterium sp. BJB304]|uniref:glycosyltransferase family 4 protein n=1 Tax=Janthinobacterium sp. BJB304 TaxID=1572871 RepID=UPI000C0F63BE|nr:glycosyltransferase family 4 protein [Janthinobacterium sp. BJB304]PHV38902.1 glycosyl transferase [Janthinobacterium sp. BJB304]